jgi:hypothetical protein
MARGATPSLLRTSITSGPGLPRAAMKLARQGSGKTGMARLARRGGGFRTATGGEAVRAPGCVAAGLAVMLGLSALTGIGRRVSAGPGSGSAPCQAGTDRWVLAESTA